MSDVVVLIGADLPRLVGAIAAISEQPVGRFAVIGGIAVAARVGRAHRATNDVDTAADQEQTPTLVEVVADLPDGRQESATRVYLDDVKVDAIAVSTAPPMIDLADMALEPALFVLAHSFGLLTATPLTVVADGEGRTVRATAPFATPGALLAMKLHAALDRPGSPKAGSDAWDIHRLLVTPGPRTLAADLRDGPNELRHAVALAARTCLIENGRRTTTRLRSIGGAAADIEFDELPNLAGQFLEALEH